MMIETTNVDDFVKLIHTHVYSSVEQYAKAITCVRLLRFYRADPRNLLAGARFSLGADGLLYCALNTLAKKKPVIEFSRILYDDSLAIARKVSEEGRSLTITNAQKFLPRHSGFLSMPFRFYRAIVVHALIRRLTKLAMFLSKYG